MTDHTTYQNKPWLAHYEQGVPENIVYEETCLPEFLETSAQKFPDKTALIFQGYTISYAKLNEMVNALAGCLTDFGIKKGESVAVLLPNIIPCLASYYAILK
ncbi:MAG: AMP-binding protein, partial [Desulfobacterales bacterium]|nr:AMP-binding protein [Desulfobacterales bacterium]